MMENNKNLKKYVVLSVLLISVFVLIMSLFHYLEYIEYRKNTNLIINNIVEKVTIKYPNVSKKELISIINNHDLNTDNVLSEYGINLENDDVILMNHKRFSINQIVYTSITLIFSLILILIFLIFNHNKNKEIRGIIHYAEEINNRNYKLDISTNSEEELSILKNELYKMTIMLKEEADNSLKDKINLKNSLSDISHQLKTPLTSITIMLDDLMSDKNMSKEVRDDFIKDISLEIDNINFLVQSLLKLSKFDANAISFNQKDVLLNEIITKSIKNVNMISDLKNIKFLFNEPLNIKVKVDDKWQVEAITNILKNCVEHSPNGSAIEINIDDNHLYTKITIKDHGYGISTKDLPHIFKRFYKGENASKDSIGIGLALSKMIIEKDNGTIDVTSILNEGTTFIICYFK